MCIRDSSYIGDMMDKEAPDFIEEFMLLPFSMKAVSYTHLDVYKRQLLPFPTTLPFPSTEVV